MWVKFLIPSHLTFPLSLLNILVPALDPFQWLVDKLSETRIVKFGSKMASTTQRLVRWSWAQAASLTWYTASTAILMVGPAVFLAVTEPALGENNRLFGDPHNPGSASAIGAAAAAEQIASDNASLRAAGLSQAYHSAPVSIPPPV